MKKKIITIVLASMLSVSMAACGESENTDTAQSEPEYVDNINAVASDPDAYAGKYIKFSGITSVIDESDEAYDLQIYLDTDYNTSVLVNVPKELISDPITSDEYVNIDAEIAGAYTGETIIGVETTWAMLNAIGIEETSYMEAFAPTIKELTPGISAEQNGFSVTADKIEYADEETRVYLTITNNSEYTTSYSVYDIRLIQNGTQIEQDQSAESSYLGNYPQLSYDVTSGASTSGIIVFPTIDQTKNFQIIIPDIYSDNYELDFSDMTLDISVQ